MFCPPRREEPVKAPAVSREDLLGASEAKAQVGQGSTRILPPALRGGPPLVVPDSEPQRLSGGRPLKEPLPPPDVVWGNAGVGSPLRLIQLSNPARQPGRGIPLPVVGDGRGPRGGADSIRARSDREPGASTNAGGSPPRSAPRTSRGDSLRKSFVNGSDVSAARRRRWPLPPAGSVRRPRRVRGRRVPRRVRGRRGSTRNRSPGTRSVEAASG